MIPLLLNMFYVEKCTNGDDICDFSLLYAFVSFPNIFQATWLMLIKHVLEPNGSLI